MPATTKKITDVEFIDQLVAIEAKTPDEYKRKAEALVKTKGLTIVDEEGNELDAALVISAAAPSEAMEEEEESKAEGEETTDEEEDTNGLAKSLSAQLAAQFKQTNAAMSRTLDAQVKLLAAHLKGGETRNDDKGKWGFKHIGEFAIAIKHAITGQGVDDRLRQTKMVNDKGIETKAPTTFANSNVGADGGFLIAPDFNSEIMRHMLEQPSIMSRCRKLTTSANSQIIPIDQTTPWGTDGIQAYWVNSEEGQQITQSKPKIGEDTVSLHQLAVLAPVTDSLLEDSGQLLAQYLPGKASEKINWKIDNAVLNGTGAGQPQGIRGSGALKTVSRTTGAGVAIDEVVDLLAAVPGSAYASGGLTFIAHHLCIPDILTAAIGNTPLFVTEGGGEDAKPLVGRMYGVYSMFHQAAQARDSAGDLSLHDLAQYLLLTKGDGIKSDVSIHLYFDYLQTAFRFGIRVGGQPWPSTTIADANGGGTTSPFAEIGST